MHLKNYIFPLLLIFQLEYCSDSVFESTSSSSDTEIKMYKDTNLVGFVSYRKIPLVPWYAIHSLYVYPNFRSNGYGSALINHTCLLLKKKKATRAYIQPGPFELDDDTPICVSPENRKEKLHSLIRFYERLQFKKAHAGIRICASLFYFFAQIKEDADCLMVKQLQ